MHDPKTVAFEIAMPWRGKEYCEPILTIWHVDPCIGGDENSCGWVWPPLTDREDAIAEDLATNEFDNMQRWFPNEPDWVVVSRIKQIFRIYKHHARPWWKHPRWHFWHWEFQIHPLQHFKRWMFSRCAYCGGRFPWGYCPVGTQWDSDGPQWFKGEREIYHHECLERKLYEERN